MLWHYNSRGQQNMGQMVYCRKANTLGYSCRTEFACYLHEVAAHKATVNYLLGMTACYTTRCYLHVCPVRKKLNVTVFLGSKTYQVIHDFSKMTRHLLCSVNIKIPGKCYHY